MSALEDAKRYLWLKTGGALLADDPGELLEALVTEVSARGFNTSLTSANIRLSTRVAELEQELRESGKRNAAVIEDLRHQVDGGPLKARIQALETQLEKAKSQTAAFRRALVQKDNRDKQP